MAKVVARAFAKRGISIVTNARFDPAGVRVNAGGVSVTVGPEGGEAHEIQAGQMLAATGRAANIEAIGLETTRAVVERGYIVVDGVMRTAEPHLDAIGDVIGRLLLAHVAAHEVSPP